jgi:phosphotriesterase-related protein
MARVMTVCGPIHPEELGFTSMHEHILCDGTVSFNRTVGMFPDDMPVKPDDEVSLENIGWLQRNFSLTQDGCNMQDVEVMMAEVSEYKDSGGNALVDQSALGVRSDVSGIKHISEETGVHVITTTGLYTEDSWPNKYRNMSRDEFESYILDEIAHGIEYTGIKPGALKFGITDLSRQQELALRAMGRVINETDMMATVHPGFEIGNDGRRVVQILKEEGVNLERVVIVHGDAFFTSSNLTTLIRDPASWRLTLDYHKELFDQGANISIGCFGHQWL